MVDVEAAGYCGPPFRFDVEAGAIRELARAAGSRQAAYLGADPIAPPLLLKVAQFRWEPEDGSAVARVGWSGPTPPLHARQEFEFTGEPPPAGARLTARTTVAAVRERPSRSLGLVAEVVLATRFTDAAGMAVATARSTSVQPLGPVTPADTSGRGRSAAVRRDADANPRASGGPARTVGPLTLTELVRYQGASGDLNPVHHDPAAARAAGWPAVLVPGLYPAAVLSDLATERYGADRIRRLDVRFAAPAWLGDTLDCSVGAAELGDGRCRVPLLCWRAGDGTTIVRGVAEFAAVST